MKIQKSVLVLTLTALIFVFAPRIAHAETATGSAMKERAVESVCTRITSHVETLKTRLTNDENIRLNRHQGVIDRVNTIIARLKANNMNADKLTADVTALMEKKAKWQTEYTLLLTKLDATKQYACGASQGQYVQAVKDARAQRLVMHNANMDFWNYVRNTVRPDIQTIRTQLKAVTKK
jgi:hypothetical protein